MALDIPMPELSGDAFTKGLSAGSDLIHKMMLNKYYGQLHPSGSIANAMYVEQLRQQFGENDPRYLNAKAAFDLGQQATQSLIGYRGVLGATAPYRASTTLGKTIAEGKGQGALDILHGPRQASTGGGVNSGYSYDAQGNNVVGSQQDIDNAANNDNRTPEEREAYTRSINKQTSDADARKRLNFATNLDITRKSVDPVALTAYAGPQGALQLANDALQAAKGNASQRYLDYQKALTASKLMAKQMRQFYSDSIQKPAMNQLLAMTNPSSFFSNPQVAQAKLAELNRILDIETETYRNKGTSPIQLNGLNFKDGHFVVGNGNAPASNKSANKPALKDNVEQVKNIGGTTFHKINGKWMPFLGDQ